MHEYNVWGEKKFKMCPHKHHKIRSKSKIAFLIENNSWYAEYSVFSSFEEVVCSPDCVTRDSILKSFC